MGRVNPNVAIAVAAVAIVAIEAVSRSEARYAPEVFIAGLALAGAWLRRDELDRRVIVAIAAVLPALIATVHLARGVAGDIDVQAVYPAEGRSLLNGTYPHSEYPPGAVLLFAGEQWIGSARSVNPFAMALAEGVIAASLCSLRTAHARWLAAFLALWPTSFFFWEFKFDALPTALLMAGLALACRERWVLSGTLLGAGAAVKWSPAVAAALLIVWLIAHRRRGDVVRHAAAFSISFLAIVGPFIVWRPHAVWASVSRQAPRGITPESLWYLPLNLFGRARAPGAIFDAATVPAWANSAAVIVQVLVLLALGVLLVVRRVDLLGAVAVAAAGPTVFLLFNKIFSAQYVLTVMAGVCFGAALVKRPRAAAALLALAGAGNVLVYPIGRYWHLASAMFFAASLAAVAWVIAGVVARSRYPHAL